jgi:hypothetical protein
MPLSRRYTPEKDPGESSTFGMDFSTLIPPGVGISGGTLAIFTNTKPPIAADADWSKGTVTVYDRTLYAMLGGGKVGIDYLLTWTATDTNGNVWPRSALCLCAPTS